MTIRPSLLGESTDTDTVPDIDNEFQYRSEIEVISLTSSLDPLSSEVCWTETWSAA
jgi:hypothetical protein